MRPHSILSSTEGSSEKMSAAAPRVDAPRSGRRFTGAARVILPCLGVLAYGASLALMTPDMFLRIFDSEYGPVELGTAACFGAASALAFGLVARSRGIVPVGFRLLYLLFALGALFAGLEEISYGQHFFGWRSPHWFAEQNAQHETNLHNLFADRPGKFLRNGALVGVGLGGIALPAAAMLTGAPYAPGRWASYILPRGELIPLVTVTLLMRAFRTLPTEVRAGRDTALFEMVELYLAIAALAYVLVLRRRLLPSADFPEDRRA